MPQAITLLLVRTVYSSANSALARVIFAGTTYLHDMNASAVFTLLSLFAVDIPTLVSFWLHCRFVVLNVPPFAGTPLLLPPFTPANESAAAQV